MTRIAFGLLLALLVGVRIHRAWTWPASMGYDAYGHGHYLQQVFGGHLPAPDEGWEFNQPPLYYGISALVARGLGLSGAALDKTGQMVSCVAGLLALPLVWGLAGRLGLTHEARRVAVVLAAALPAQMVVAAMVSNHSFGYLMAVLFLGALVWAAQEQKLRVGRECCLGLLAGLAAAARIELMVDTALLGVLWLVRMRRGSQRDATLALLLSVCISLSVQATYSLPLLAHFDKLAMSNLDSFPFPRRTADWHLFPGFVCAHLFTSADTLVWEHPGHPTGLTSIWTATFASWWWDYHGYEKVTPTRRLEARMLFCLGLLVTGLSLLGIRVALQERAVWWPVLWQCLASWGFYLIILTMSKEFDAMNAAYLFPTFAPVVLLAALGASRLPRGRPALAVVATALALVCAVTFF